MLSTTNAIVLSKLKYGENDLIVKCYTEKHGVVSFLIRGVLRSTKTNKKAAYFQSLSQLQLVFNYNKTKNLHSIKEVKMHRLYANLHTHVLKSTVVLFLAEILNACLKEEEENHGLYLFLENSLLWFDTMENAVNFHLLFLLKLTKYLGFYPDTKHNTLSFFNLEEGCFQMENQTKYCILGENLVLFKALLGTTFDALYLMKLNTLQRRSLLNIVLLYYELHLSGFKPPKSLPVLNQVFN